MDERLVLADVIYQLHKKQSLYGSDTMWGTPSINFLASTKETIRSRAPKFIKDVEDKKLLREDTDDIICILKEWDAVAEGIIFTSKALYVNTPKNKMKRFRVRYDDITKLDIDSDKNRLEITDYEDKSFVINDKLWNSYVIYLFLQYASYHCDYTDDEIELIGDINLPHLDNVNLGAMISGIVYGNVSNASTIYGETKFSAIRGHGFAAERAGHLYDKINRHDAHIVGDDNAKNGADRLVDGVNIQSKYCRTGSACISECFENGEFRYYNSDGTPMQIEVPSDKYDAAVQAMKERIRKGEIKGITDPEQAESIVKKGSFTYEQVKNIAKAGTIESITYDAVNGAIIATTTFGITAVITFATSIWNGENLDVALKNAAYSGLKVGGITFVTAVLAGQMTKAGLNSTLVGSSEAIIVALGPKGSAVLVNAFRSGKNIYGAAAMKSAAKMLRNNVITGIASVVILSTGDVVNIFRGRISTGQLIKNITGTASAVAGGTAGWIAGATAGAAAGSVIPGAGNAVGAIAGGIIGAMGAGTVAGEVTDAVMDKFIKNDADEMIKIIEKRFITLAENYLLTQREVEHVIDHMGESLTPKNLKDMYASNDRENFADTLIIPHIDREIKRRVRIGEISGEEMQRGLRLLLEDIADDNPEMVVEI